jgi:hypothetical protein
MAAFEGAADPSDAIQRGYFVDAPDKLLVDNISGRIALRPRSSHLLIGGIGSGKTSQLLVACKKINEIEDILAIYVDVSLQTDISKISTNVLTAITGLELAKLIEDSEDENIKRYIETLKNLADGYIEERFVFSATVIQTQRHKGIIPKKSEQYGINTDLFQIVSEISKTALNKYKHIVLLFDGLDRLNDVKTFMDLLDSDVKAISSMGIGIVIVGPLTAIYTEYREPVDHILDYFEYQPFFDVDSDPEAYTFFEKIIQTRSSEDFIEKAEIPSIIHLSGFTLLESKDFIEKAAIPAIIHFSGGILRDLISLTQAAIEETYLAGEDKLKPECVLKVVDSYSRNKLLGVSDEQLEILQRLLNAETFTPRTDEELKLLTRSLILEYRKPKRRYAVHPVIQPLIKQIAA